MILELPFDAVFSEESSGNIRTPQNEYLRSGLFPVIDQGERLIAGYVNDEARICGSGRPAIVFGDHTRRVKYIDYPFCMGADGLKVFRPKIKANLKFLYHQLANLKLPDAGYSRHFKYLKRTTILLPSLEEQGRIVAILDKAESLRAKRQQAIAELDKLAQSIFIEMFGDPAKNPKNLPVATIGDILESASYGTSQKASTTGKLPVLRMGNITRAGEIDCTDLKYVELKESEHERFLVKQGDVLFNRTNSPELVGKTALYRHKEPMAYAGYLIRLRVNSENESEYLAGFMNTIYAKRVLRNMCKSIVGMANINAQEVKNIKILKPPRELQIAYQRKIEKMNELKTRQKTAFLESEMLFSCLKTKAFSGEL